MSIVCSGRSRAAPVGEMQSALQRKPAGALPRSLHCLRSRVLVPTYAYSLHHELQLGVVMRKRLCAGRQAAVVDCVAGYALCLDETARDMQEECKKKGLLATQAKSSTASCPVRVLVPKEKIPDPQSLKLWLKVSG
ncbi:acylpyruvase FAHD1, mitochondrial-like [Lagenorhynchus albirostris]|uniref:acylpyruvase FAHD1, mitochondrial-like n=1 Tax=Lagenorhynchus albirostris TaxID=27610 RepID=UPI0028E7ED95|nr:acylpyruvase FAHD1, mitochondrial-like [Lagenorhynchus albirostris]